MKNTSLPFIAMLLFGCSLKEGPAAIARVGAKNGSNVSGSIIFEKYKGFFFHQFFLTTIYFEVLIYYYTKYYN